MQGIPLSRFRGAHSPPLVIVVIRTSQFAAELLVVGITWWYTYRSYRIRTGFIVGKPISSLLVYNGESLVDQCDLS